MTPLVSILIPAFNAEPWIEETLRSALGQTWPRKEIVIVDDGSTDRTLAIARRFGSREVFVTTQDNQGAAAARNKAYSLSQGDYIQWLDADDLLGPQKVTRQMEAALALCASKRTLLSSEWAYFIYRARKADFVPTPLWCDLTPIEWLLRKMALNLHMQPATWLVSRPLSEAAGPWDTRLSLDDDGEYFCRVLLASDGIRFVPGAKTYYRRASFSSLSNVGREKLDSQFLSMQLHISYLRSLEDTERVRIACITFLRNWMPCFYPNRPDIVTNMKRVAEDLGGKLEIPQLSWKYNWIQRAFGWNLARRAQVYLPRLKWSLIRSWDRLLSWIEDRTSR